MKLSKEFYDRIVMLVNDGYRLVDKERLSGFHNTLIVAVGSIEPCIAFISTLCSYRNDLSTFKIVSQPARNEKIKTELPELESILCNWNGRYTKTVIDMFDEGEGFDSFLFFGMSPVSTSNTNLIEIADYIIKELSGKGCFVYSFNDNRLYEYDNIHTFYSALTVNNHINRLLEYKAL